MSVSFLATLFVIYQAAVLWLVDYYEILVPQRRQLKLGAYCLVRANSSRAPFVRGC